MALDTQPAIAPYDAPIKDLTKSARCRPRPCAEEHVCMGDPPRTPWRTGTGDAALRSYSSELDSNEVLVLVMAAGVNYNGVWAGLGVPISPFDGHKQPYQDRGFRSPRHRLGGRRQGEALKVGDEVVVHCNQDDGDDEECNGGDPMFSTQRIWGYETHDGQFASSTRVQAQQLMPRPKHLTWEESACYTLTLASVRCCSAMRRMT